jgi:hypothetical protein
VLLPCDTHINTITSITAVLLPFVAYLLTLPHIYFRMHVWMYATLALEGVDGFY